MQETGIFGILQSDIPFFSLERPKEKYKQLNSIEQLTSRKRVNDRIYAHVCVCVWRFRENNSVERDYFAF